MEKMGGMQWGSILPRERFCAVAGKGGAKVLTY